MQLECGFVSIAEKKIQIECMMHQIFNGLNSAGECVLFVDNANSINLKLFPFSIAPPDILDYKVPTRILEVSSTSITENWDLTLQEILPYIDGIRHVKRIAIESGVDIDLVRSAVRQLVFFRCVVLIDIIQFSSVYTVTARIDELARNQVMQAECVDYVVESTNESSSAPTFQFIFSLYCNLSRIDFMSFWSLYKPTGIDPLKFLMFGIMNKIIRKVERYSLKGTKPGIEFGEKWMSLINKTSSFTEMQCELNLSFEQLALAMQNHTNNVTILQ